MVPVEPISLGIGIAALFTACIQCFEYFKAATTLREDFEILLLKLELEQERLLIWGENLGIGGQHWSEEQIFKGDSKRQHLSRRCLNTIKTLLQDAETLKVTYGLQLVTGTTNAGTQSISSNALKRLRVRLGRSSNGLGMLYKTRWAIHDAAKFQKLINHVRDLVDGLMGDVLGSQSLHSEKVQNDIASMADDVSKLRLVSEACSDVYPEWSDIASRAIDVSEIGTNAGYLTNDSIALAQIKEHEIDLPDVELRSCWGFGDYNVMIHSSTNIYFVLTEQCRNEGTDSPCDMFDLGGTSFWDKYCFVSPNSYLIGSSPGHWIAKDIDRQQYTSLDLDKYTESHLNMQARAVTRQQDDPSIEHVFSVKLYIYCPTCVCQITTAIQICESINRTPFLKACIRVDYREPTSCSSSSSRIDGIASLISYIKGLEQQPSLTSVERLRLKAIDRQWLEQCHYDYEEEDQIRMPSPPSRLARIISPHASEPTCAGIIMLGESDRCNVLLGAPPFPPFRAGRMPLETQLYKMEQIYEPEQKWRWQRQFLGTYTSQRPLA